MENLFEIFRTEFESAIGRIADKLSQQRVEDEFIDSEGINHPFYIKEPLEGGFEIKQNLNKIKITEKQAHQLYRYIRDKLENKYGRGL